MMQIKGSLFAFQISIGGQNNLGDGATFQTLQKLINPQIIACEGSMFEEEGCLSLPGVYAKIQRHARVRVRALDARGRPFEMEGAGLLGRAFQHEVDHLDGKLFIDHLSFTDKLKVLALVKDLRRDWT